MRERLKRIPWWLYASIAVVLIAIVVWAFIAQTTRNPGVISTRPSVTAGPESAHLPLATVIPRPVTPRATALIAPPVADRPGQTPVITKHIAQPTWTIAPTSQPIWMKAPVDLSFSDLEHGWLLGLACDNDKIRNNCVPALRKSTDGGATWERATMPPAGVARVKQAGTDAQVDYIRFMTPKDGWMFGPGLFSTHDGGKTWQDEHPSGEIAALEVNDKSVWAVERSCAKPYEECIFTLRTSTDKGRTWEWTVVPVKDPWYTAQLVRLNANTAWLYTWGDEMSLSKSSLLATHDGGKTWQPRIHPCLPEAAKLVSEPPGKLWLFCGSEPGAGSQGKRLYGSSNDGRTWKIVASTLESETQGLNNLPIGGDFSDFVRTAPGKLWALYYGSSGHLERSTDAGRTWSAVKIGDYLEAATGPIVFKDALHGWLPVYHRVWRTTDGGDNWTPFDIDPGFQEDTGP